MGTDRNALHDEKVRILRGFSSFVLRHASNGIRGVAKPVAYLNSLDKVGRRNDEDCRPVHLEIIVLRHCRFAVTKYLSISLHGLGLYYVNCVVCLWHGNRRGTPVFNGFIGSVT